jgi:choline dehydrogenase
LKWYNQIPIGINWYLFRRAHGESAYHPSCTCKVGQDEMAVVDGEGRVYGMDNLRVIDASIMPEITNGNLNAPTIMLAEKLVAGMTGEQGV